MSSDGLVAERAVWAAVIKAHLQDFQYQEHLTDHSTTFVVSHARCPAWKVNVVINAVNAGNRVEIDGTVFSFAFSSNKRDKLADALNSQLQCFIAAANTPRLFD